MPMECFPSESRRTACNRESAISGRLLFFLSILLLLFLLCGCEFFSTEQERRGVNPKPFNSQPAWETNPYNFRN